jgi:hypothetical protein
MPEPKPRAKPHAGTLALASALEQSQPLARLLQRLQESRQRFDSIRPHLPETLRDQVGPGPLDEAGWSLLVSHGAAASKLRQLVPTLEAELLRGGWQHTSIRIKIRSV